MSCLNNLKELSDSAIFMLALSESVDSINSDRYIDETIIRYKNKRADAYNMLKQYMSFECICAYPGALKLFLKLFEISVDNNERLDSQVRCLLAFKSLVSASCDNLDFRFLSLIDKDDYFRIFAKSKVVVDICEDILEILEDLRHDFEKKFSWCVDASIKQALKSGTADLDEIYNFFKQCGCDEDALTGILRSYILYGSPFKESIDFVAELTKEIFDQIPPPETSLVDIIDWKIFVPFIKECKLNFVKIDGEIVVKVIKNDSPITAIEALCFLIENFRNYPSFSLVEKYVSKMNFDISTFSKEELTALIFNPNKPNSSFIYSRSKCFCQILSVKTSYMKANELKLWWHDNIDSIYKWQSEKLLPDIDLLKTIITYFNLKQIEERRLFACLCKMFVVSSELIDFVSITSAKIIKEIPEMAEFNKLLVKSNKIKASVRCSKVLYELGNVDFDKDNKTAPIIVFNGERFESDSLRISEVMLVESFTREYE